MNYRLSVDRQHLLAGLRLLKGPLDKKVHAKKVHADDTAILGYDGQYLTIEARERMVLAQAIGSWPGNASVSTTLIRALAKAPPRGDPIIVACDGEHVHFGPVKIGCRWQPVSAALLDVPPHREWTEAIALKYRLPRGRIVAEGLGSEVKAAERKLGAVVRRAAKSLTPFGVTVADVQGLVERRLEQRYRLRR